MLRLDLDIIGITSLTKSFVRLSRYSAQTTGILVLLYFFPCPCTKSNLRLSVARHVSPYTTTSQCQTRYVRTVDPGIKRGTWSSEENERLRKAIAAFGNSWIDVAGVLPGRTNEQCRERWSEVTSSHGGKGEWSIEEEEMLLHLVKELGNKWKAISTKIGGGKTGPHVSLSFFGHNRCVLTHFS
jgi:hypothetical protein